jgi:hypothetical protein
MTDTPHADDGPVPNTDREQDFRSKVLRALLESDAMRRDRRADRMIWLSGHVPSFGVMAGPMDTLRLIEEARTTYLDGHFIAAVLTALALIERLIIGELAARGVQCRRFEVAIRKAKEHTSLPADILARAERVRRKRNAFTHHRPEDDPDTFGNRFMASKRHPNAILEEDAQEAVSLINALLKLCVRPGVDPTIDHQLDN